MQIFSRKYWTPRRLLTLVAGAIFAALIFFNVEVVVGAIKQLADTNLAIFLLVPSSFALSYLCIANYYHYFFKAFNKKTSIKQLYKLVFALNFVNQILPSGGLSGTTYFLYGVDKTRKKIPAGLATFSHFGRYIFAYISYFFVLAGAFLFLRFGSDSLTTKFLNEGFMLVGINFTGRLLNSGWNCVATKYGCSFLSSSIISTS